MVYLVVGGEYEDWFIEGYFDNEYDALKYCALYPEKKFYVQKVDNLNIHLNEINNNKFISIYCLSFTIFTEESITLEERITCSYSLDKNKKPNKITYIDSFFFEQNKPRLIMDINAQTKEEAIEIAINAIEKMSNNYTKKITQKEVDIMNTTWRDEI